MRQALIVFAILAASAAGCRRGEGGKTSISGSRPMATPAAKVAPKVPTREIAGVTMRNGSKGDAASLKWGMTKDEVASAFGRTPVHCLDKNGPTTTCYTGELPKTWVMDFGDSFRWRLAPLLTFDQQGKWYSYWVSIDEGAYEDVRSALVGRLGAPVGHTASTVQNRMGATFDQEALRWAAKDVDVILLKRRPDNLSEGMLMVTYEPLSSKIPAPPSAKAPF